MRQSNREEVFPSAESPPMATTARAVVINTKSQEHHPSVPCHFLQSQEFTPHFWNSHLPFVLPIFFPTSNNLCANSLTASTSTFMATLGPLCFVFTRNRVLWWVLRLSTWNLSCKDQQQMPTDTGVQGWESLCKEEEILSTGTQNEKHCMRESIFFSASCSQWWEPHYWVIWVVWFWEICFLMCAWSVGIAAGLCPDYTFPFVFVFLQAILVPLFVKFILMILASYLHDCHDWSSCPSFFSVSEWHSETLFWRKLVKYLTLL